MGGGKVVISIIDSPIERGQTKGNANAILHYGIELSPKQISLLEKLPFCDSRIFVSKNKASMSDLSALTAATGDEFTMFTLSSKRLIIRGNKNSVNINFSDALTLANQGYKWSGHTHPGIGERVLLASKGDLQILSAFLQPRSTIYNSSGQYQLFYLE
jgi:hypothetical protein